MGRPLRILVPGGVYHVMSRGTERTNLFQDDADRAGFLAVLRKVNERFDFECWSYCLLGNHFHLLIKTRQPNLSRGIQQLKSVYSQHFNARHQRIGPLYAARFQSPLVQHDRYGQHLLRYLALNPVKHGFSEDPLTWRWSAHAVLAGLRPPDGNVDVHAALALFGDDVLTARVNYLRYVAAGDPWEELPADVAVIGDPEFQRAHLPEARPSDEIAVRQWGDGRPSLQKVLARRTDGAIVTAYRHHGYTIAEIAEVVGCHRSTISRRLARAERDA